MRINFLEIGTLCGVWAVRLLVQNLAVACEKNHIFDNKRG